MKHFLYSIVTVSALVAGCASGPMPQNASEYRTGIKKGGFGTNFENYVVDRSYTTVAKTLKNKSEECLHAAIQKTTCQTKTSCQERTNYYTPTVKSGKGNTELHVQWRREPWDGVFLGGKKPPEAGMYITVVDVKPAGTGKTEVSLYGPSIENLQTVPKAIKHWIDGSNLGCPNLTKTYYY